MNNNSPWYHGSILCLEVLALPHGRKCTNYYYEEFWKLKCIAEIEENMGACGTKVCSSSKNFHY